MSRQPVSNRLKFVCYPMVGSAEQQVLNLLQTLKWINDTQPSRSGEVWKWLQIAFRPHKPLDDKYAQNIYTVLLRSTGLVITEDGKCRLTRNGYLALHSPSYDHLLTVFAESFVGLAEILEILQTRGALMPKALLLEWFALASSRFPRTRGWPQKYISNQFRTRIDWLRSFGAVELVDGRYRLTAAGRRFTAEHPPEVLLLSPDEIKAEEKVIQSLMTKPFTPFDEAAERVQSLRQAYVRSQVFRDKVVRAYNYACAVCNLCLRTPDGAYEIQAAHIIPRSKRGTNHPRNGLALCGIHHWAFDRGVISIAVADLTVLVAAYIKEQVGDSSAAQLVQFERQPIRSTVDKEYAPATVSLQWHNENVFLG